MNVSLTEELETLVKEKVQSGLYTSTSEVICEALRLLKDRDSVQKQRLTELRREIEVGLDELKQRQSFPGEQEFKELRQRSQARKQAAKKPARSEIGTLYDGPLIQSVFEDFLRRREQEAFEQKQDVK